MYSVDRYGPDKSRYELGMYGRSSVCMVVRNLGDVVHGLYRVYTLFSYVQPRYVGELVDTR